MAEAWINIDSASAAAVKEPPAKRTVVGSTSKESLERELNIMICTEQALQATRNLMAVAWWTVELNSELLAPALATTQAHAKATKGISGHNMGSPHVQPWRTYLVTLVEELKNIGHNQDHM